MWEEGDDWLYPMKRGTMKEYIVHELFLSGLQWHYAWFCSKCIRCDNHQILIFSYIINQINLIHKLSLDRSSIGKRLQQFLISNIVEYYKNYLAIIIIIYWLSDFQILLLSITKEKRFEESTMIVTWKQGKHNFSHE